MAKTNNNSLKLQRAVRSLFYDYQEKNGCLGTTYAQAACGCDNALQMWRGPKGDKGDQGPQGPKGDNAGSFLVSAEFVVNPAGQPEGSYLKLVLIDVAQQEQVVYVNLSELEDVYSAGNGIDITSMVVAAKLGAGLTFDNQGNITSAYQFCDGLDETSNVVKVKLDAGNNILGFAGSGCKGLTATVNLTQAASGVALVLTGASGAVLSTIPLEGGTGITVQKNAQTGGFTWLVDFSDVISSTAGNNLTISDNKLYVGNSTLSYTVGDGVFTLTNPAGGTSTVTLPTVVRSLDRADLVCEGENAPYLRLTFKRDNGQNLYQDVSLACLASALDVISDVNIDVQCETSRDLEPIFLAQYYGAAQAGLITQEEYEQWVQNTSYSPSIMAGDQNYLLDTSSLHLSCDVEYEGDPPVAYAAYVELVSNNDSFWFAPNPDVTEFNWSVYVPLSTLLAAGDEGYRLAPVATTDPDYTGDGTNANIPNRTIRVVTTMDTSGAVPEYTVTYYWDNGVSDKPTTDLVITNAGGDETRVDLNPALTHVGGNVLTVADTADRELVVLHTFNDLPRTESGAPNGYAVSMNMYPNANVCDNSNRLAYLSDNASDGVYTMYVESGTITHFAVSIDEYIPVPGGTQYDYSWNRFETYVEIDHANNNACIDVDNCTSVADLTTTGVVIYGHDTQGKRLEELSLYLTGELVEDGQGHPGLAIRAYRQGVKKVLRLGPSCSSDIPLADLGGISGAALDIDTDGCLPSCEGVTSVVPEGEPILFRVELQYLTEQRYDDVVAGTESSVDGTTTISTNHGEATVTTGNMSSYYAVCIQVAVQDCCFIYNDSRIDSYVSPNIAEVPNTLWESPSYPIPISTLLSAGDEGIELSLLSHYNTEPAYGTDKLIVIATANQDGSLTLSFKIRKPAITGCFVVPGLPEPYTTSPDHPISLNGFVSVNGTTVLGANPPSQNQGFAELESDSELHSFTVTNTTEDDGPVYIVLRIDGARSDDFWNDYYLTVPSWTAFVAAGEAGLPMVEACDSCGYYYEGDDLPPVCIKFFGKKMYLSCTAEGNNVYRLYPFVMPQYTEVAPEEPEGLKADLVLTDTGGNETRVDMKPLLAHVGGEVKDVVVGSESVPLIGDDVEETYAGFVCDYIEFNYSATGWCEGGGIATVESEVTANNSIDFCLGETPIFLYVELYRVNAYGQEAEPSVGYTTWGPDTECDESGGHIQAGQSLVFANYLAAGSAGLPLYRVENWDYSTGVPSDFCLVVTPLEGENCYRLSVVQAQVAQRLCLEPSCDPCIDLSPAVADCVTHVTASVDCEPADLFDGISSLYFTFYDANGNSVGGTGRIRVNGETSFSITVPVGSVSFDGYGYGPSNSQTHSQPYYRIAMTPVSRLTVGGAVEAVYSGEVN